MASRKVYCLGPAGTNAHQAALRLKEPGDEVRFCSTNVEAMRRARMGRCVVVPIENRGSGGMVNDVLWAWIDIAARWHKTPKVTRECALPIAHRLLVHPSAAGKQIVRVLSHPQAFAQCSLSNTATRIPMASTADAAKRLSESPEMWPDTAAIASSLAAKLYGLVVAKDCIQVVAHNTTRFHLLNGTPWDESYEKVPFRSALIMQLEDIPGSIVRALNTFSANGINISAVHSIDLSGKGDYHFYIEVDAKLTPSIMQSLSHFHRGLIILGSYPREM